ncbi:MAG: peptidoglycan-binding protein, partial [Clostridia bacterium]|nr:peptidoglycan-binding protein [Clostridia bacterium]
MAEFPTIPEFITVHLGAPSDNSVENVTVSFPDYIKNVASSEIFPTWNEEAIRANIYAQISYALNRVYTEYYRSQGYNFDITNTTALDQSFVRGRNVFENVAQIVDEIFDSYIRRAGFVEPLFAQYCNGTTTTCDGLSQWGSESLAAQGRTAEEILRNYYGNDIEIVSDVPVEGITESLPLRSLRVGSSGDDVRSIQNRLNRISVNYPAIPKIADVNGFYDQNTENAVREFQRIFNLTADGVVGRATWYRIQYIYNNIKRLNSLNAEGITPGDISLQFPRVLRPGDTGTGVDVIQYLLNYVAQFENSVAPFDQSGVYDQQTEAAVVSFQKLYGLNPDGIVG